MLAIRHLFARIIPVDTVSMTNALVASTCAACLLFSPFINAQPLKVGISLVDLSNPFFSTLAEQISHELKQSSADGTEIYIHSSAYNLNKQIAQLDDYIEKQVDIIFVAASETQAIAPFVARASKRGIIVVAVDIESTGADIVVTSDNTQAGDIACRYLAQKIGGKGQVAIINGQRISSVINRVTGCKNALQTYPDIELVSYSHNSSGTYSGGLESMTYLLIEYPDLKGVFTINDPSALGAKEASIQLQRSNIKIVAVDASPEFLAQIDDPETNFIASTAQFPKLMAHQAVQLALKALSAQRTSHHTELIPTRLVNQENAGSFSDWEQLPTD